MSIAILIVSFIVLFSVVLNRLSNKIGIPMLLAFIVLGMVFGTDGLFKIEFENYLIVEQICTVALIFIMFYGGFGTKWSQAKPISIDAALLSTLGVVLTAGITGMFCYFVLDIEFLESLLIGSVISSTDAASVFSILRSKKLGLKYNTSSMLEVESGSNDPSSYMLTLIVLSVMKGNVSAGNVAYMIFAQFFFGIVIGVLVAVAASALLRRLHFADDGFEMVFVIGIALLSYALPTFVGGNGYLSVYLVGIIMGNGKIHDKYSLVHFFDGITGLMQLLIFFLLGLLATPSKIPSVFVPAMLIAIFITFIARPLAVFAILAPSHCKLAQKLLVSFAGLRGAASIVFAIMATVDGVVLEYDIYHIVFCIVLFSILFQGTLIPIVAKKLAMIDADFDVLITFNDYNDKKNLQFLKLIITCEHPWIGKRIKELELPPDTLIIMVMRNNHSIIPNGETQMLEGDVAILSGVAFVEDIAISLKIQKITEGSKWKDKTISAFYIEHEELVIMIQRNDQIIIPSGNTMIEENDILVLNAS